MSRLDKKTTIKPKNKEDNCFQYAVTIALNFEEIWTINFSWAASMLTHSLHTNIPLEETINICTNLLVAGYSRIVIHIQFSVWTKGWRSHGMTSWTYYSKCFFSISEVRWLEECPKEFKPVFHDYFNTCHPNMSFSYGQEKNGKLLFLVVEVSREKGKFVTNV